MAYVQDDPDKLLDYLDIKLVESGANVMILDPYDEGVFYETKEIDGSMVVSFSI